jgi:branched-chain amino acid transport system permease protein
MPDTSRSDHLSSWNIQKSVTGPTILIIATIFLVILPVFTDAGTLRLMIEIMSLVIMAQAWNLLAGYTGFVSIGQQAFIGIGAYSLFIISIETGLHPFLAVPLGGLTAAAIGALAAPALFRLRGPYFAIGTWVLAEIFSILILNSQRMGSGIGLNLARIIKTIPRNLRTNGTYWIALGFTTLTIFLVYFLLRSRFGLAIRTVRDNEASAESVGVNIWKIKFIVFVIAAGLTGCAGAISYLNTMFINPFATFSVEWSALLIFVVIIGGIGTIEGPIIGVLVYFFLREWLADFGTWYIITLGVIAIITMLFAPEGLWGLFIKRFNINLFPVGAKVTMKNINNSN